MIALTKCLDLPILREYKKIEWKEKILEAYKTDYQISPTYFHLCLLGNFVFREKKKIGFANNC